MNENQGTNNIDNNQPVQNPQPVEQPMENPELQNTTFINPQPMQSVHLNMDGQNIGMQTQVTASPKSNNNLLYILIPIIAVLVLLIGFASYYFISSNNPTSVYRNIIKNGINEMFSLTDIKEEKINTTMNLDLDLDLEEGLLDEETLDLINNTDLGLNTQLDMENHKMVLKLDADYDKDSLLDLEFYLDSKNEETYLYAEEFFDKYLEISVDDYDEIDELFEFEESIFSSNANRNKAKKILIKELTAVIKPEDCIKEDGYYVFEINEEDLYERLEKAFENLKDNKDFIDCFEDEENIEYLLDDMIYEFDPEYANDVTTRFAIKKSMFGNNIEEFIMESQGDVLKFVANGDVYDFEVESDDEKVLEGSLEIEKIKNGNKTTMTFEIPDAGTFKIAVEATQEFGKDVDTVKKSNTKNIDDLTEEEQTEIMTNIQESKIYDLISSFTGSFGTGYEDDYYYDDSDTTINTNTNSASNTIKLYDSERLVTFNIPSGYTLTYNTDSYKTFEKGDIEVTINANYYEPVDEYLNELDDDLVYYDMYENVYLTSKMSKTVNGYTFYYRDLSYDYVGYSTTKYYEKYATTHISGDDYYTLEVFSEGSPIPESDLESFLTISY